VWWWRQLDVNARPQLPQLLAASLSTAVSNWQSVGCAVGDQRLLEIIMLEFLCSVCFCKESCPSCKTGSRTLQQSNPVQGVLLLWTRHEHLHHLIDMLHLLFHHKKHQKVFFCATWTGLHDSACHLAANLP
jgi:hypothetical protein